MNIQRDGQVCAFAIAATLWLALMTAPVLAQRAGPAEAVAPDMPRRVHPTAPPPDLAARLTIHRDVVYGDKDPKFQKLDAYLLKSDTPTAVLIEVHGGGFTRGSKSAGPGGENWRIFFKEDWVYMQALRAGISVVSIDYRLAPRHPFPAQAEDLARAIQFVRSKAKEWNIDPARIASGGGSAGAHLSVWVGLHDDMADPASADPVARQSTRLTAVVNIDGPMDFARMSPMEGLLAFLKSSRENWNQTPESKAMMRLSSPLTYASADDPPVMIVHTVRSGDEIKGEAPAIITDPHSFWWGVLLAQTLEARHAPHVRHITPQRKGSGEQADAIIDFLRKQLAPPVPAEKT